MSNEVEWLFTQCESEMGLRSNFNAMILVLKAGASRPRVDKDTGELVNGAHEDAFNEDALIDAIDTRAARSRFAATARNRRVMRAFTRLDTEHQLVFAAAYEPRQVPPQVRQAFGELAGVAALTPTARKVRGYSSAWLARALARTDPRVATIRREAEQLFSRAREAYASARAEVA